MKIKRKTAFKYSQCVKTLLLGGLMSLGIAASGTQAESHDEDEIAFSEANIYFELNNTDGDLGIHALIDGDPWKKLVIEDPYERKMLKVKVKGRLRKQGMTEFFFESAEPSFDELEPEDFFERFPEGYYEVEGLSLEGEELESKAYLSHVMPAPAADITVSGVKYADDCDAFVPEVSTPITIAWSPVNSSHPDIGASGDVIVDRYQLVVEIEESETLVYSVDLPPGTTSLSVPEEFISLGEEFKYEILVRESSGNQTAVESCFAIK